VARLRVDLPKVYKLDFEKFKSKNFKNGAESRLRVAKGGQNQTNCGEGAEMNGSGGGAGEAAKPIKKV
jgi:hypothetical protein